MGRKIVDDPEAWDIARRMYRAGRANWRQITEATGIKEDRLRRELVPGYREKRNEAAKESKARKKAERARTGLVKIVVHRVSAEDAARALRTVPPDTRSLTARAFGDPLPGRSALDRRTGA